MAESDFETCLPRLRRLALCLYCNSIEGDEAITSALESIPGSILSKKNDESILRFLFSEIIAIAFDAFEEKDAKIKVNLRDMNSGFDANNNVTIIKAVSELDFTERSVVALHILEQFSMAETALLMQTTVSDVLGSLRSARSHLSQQVSLTALASQTSLRL